MIKPGTEAQREPEQQRVHLLGKWLASKEAARRAVAAERHR